MDCMKVDTEQERLRPNSGGKLLRRGGLHQGTYLSGIAIPNFPQVIDPRFLGKGRNRNCSESRLISET